MLGLQGDLPTLVVIYIAAAAFLAGLCGERLRAKLARQAWQKKCWRRGEGGVSFKANIVSNQPVSPITIAKRIAACPKARRIGTVL
jgi:hypothetical protein